ncbi:MAG: spermidine synthase [bacterium]|nr:spermidine synthase [bacterium]
MTLFLPMDDYQKFSDSLPLQWLWYYEYHSPYEVHSHAVKDIIVRAKSKYQQIDVIDTFNSGKVLILNSEPQSAQVDEYIYHESLVHPAMIACKSPNNVLIIGGGEGATLREVVKYKTVKKIVMVDIDEELHKIAKEYLKEWHQNSFEDNRVILIFDDIKNYINKALENNEKFDVIISDLNEPTGSTPAFKVYTPEFIEKILKVSSDNLVMVLQASDLKDILFWEHRQDKEYPIIFEHFELFSKYFNDILLYHAFIPSFFSDWAFLLLSKSNILFNINTIDNIIQERISGELKFYDSETHQLLFSLPKFIRSTLNKFLSKNKIKIK